MAAVPATEPPFDPVWLELLAGSLSQVPAASPQPIDLYLERRLELEVSERHGSQLLRECRTEGAAIRWQFPNRIVVHARTGVSPMALGELLAQFSGAVTLPAHRPVPAADMDAPRGWVAWARDVVARLGDGACIGFICRRAAIVQPGGWSVIQTPSLLRVRGAGARGGALLTVWPHPELPHWLGELSRGEAAKRWLPGSGLRPPVVLTAGTAGVLVHELIGHLVESDLVTSGVSPLAAMAGATITAGSMQLVDDPTRFDLPGAFSCDDEGVAAVPIPLVEQGRLNAWICDRAGAARLGAHAGRGRRGTWSQPPVARLSNLVVAAGTTAPEDMERELKMGLVVTRLSGATVDPASGRALIRVEQGWEVRNGRRRRPLAPFELTGPVLEVLAHIDPALGNDPTPEWRLGWCVKNGLPLATGSVVPSMLVHRLEVL